jgi:hypothetical protein
MELFNNKENENLKFKINSEGIDMNKVEPRLILTTKENKNYLFIGEIHNDVCRFRIPKLEQFETGNEGRIKFEIINEDMYFQVWEDEFKIKTKANIKIEEMISQINKDEEKKVSVKAILETEKPLRREPLKEHKEVVQPRIKKEEPVEPPIRNFNEFFGNRKTSH